MAHAGRRRDRPGRGAGARGGAHLIALALAAALGEGTSVLKEAANRAVGLPEAVATLGGLARPKRLRLRVAILRDERGEPVAAEQDVAESLAEARRVLEREAAVKIVPVDGRLVETLAERAPGAALDSPCAEGSWRADFGQGGAFFRRHAARSLRGTLTGSGAPLTVFVVRDVLGRGGCSLGPLVDYVTIDRGGLGGRTRRVLAHELGHACGLPHSARQGNLMLPHGPGERLDPWQRAVLRTSRHVTYS